MHSVVHSVSQRQVIVFKSDQPSNQQRQLRGQLSTIVVVSVEAYLNLIRYLFLVLGVLVTSRTRTIKRLDKTGSSLSNIYGKFTWQFAIGNRSAQIKIYLTCRI